MTVETIVLLSITALVMLYLVYALLKAEKF